MLLPDCGATTVSAWHSALPMNGTFGVGRCGAAGHACGGAYAPGTRGAQGVGAEGSDCSAGEGPHVRQEHIPLQALRALGLTVKSPVGNLLEAGLKLSRA